MPETVPATPAAVVSVHALLVGIDEYRARDVPQLSGCANDIRAAQDFLERRVAQQGFAMTAPKVLINAEATRARVIEGLEGLAKSVGAQDIAVLYFSGHGSQEACPPEFLSLEPDGFNETLVCHDSRFEGGFDLADKELAFLLERISSRCRHVLVVLDCCHSGSGTRALERDVQKVRWVPAAQVRRPFSSFVFASDATWGARAAGAALGDSGWVQGRHVLLAACRSNELAKEAVDAGGKPRGAFSVALLEVLQRLGSGSYEDLIRQVRPRVRQLAKDQEPQLEGDNLDRLRAFLDGAVAPHAPYFVLSWQADSWWIDGGVVHGVPAVVGQESTVLEVFAEGSTSEDWRDPKRSLGTVTVESVELVRSSVGIGGWLSGQPNLGERYWAVVSGLPIPALELGWSGDEAGIALVRTALRSSGPGGQASMYVNAESNPLAAALQLEAKDGVFTVSGRGGRAALVPSAEGFTPQTAARTVTVIESIARWLTLSTLSNPLTRFGPGDLELQIAVVSGLALPAKGMPDVPGTTVNPDQTMRLEYGPDLLHDQPRIEFRLVNRSSGPLYCTLLFFSEDYSIGSDYFPGRCLRLEPGVPYTSPKIYLSVPTKTFWNNGITEAHDLLKLVVSSDEFAPGQLVDQDSLLLVAPTRSAGLGAAKSTLNRMFSRVNTTRGGGLQTEEDQLSDWMTLDFHICTVRPLERAITAGGSPARLNGLTVLPHATFSAAAKLSTLQSATRGLGGTSLPVVLQAASGLASGGIEPFRFTTTSRGFAGSFPARDGELEVTALELSASPDGGFDPKLVTSEQPLKLQLAGTLEQNETLLAIAFDPLSQMWLPLGMATSANAADGSEYSSEYSSEYGSVDMALERLPEPTGTGDRSVGSAIRILFHKFIASKLNLSDPYPLLRVVNRQKLLASGQVEYSANGDLVAVKTAVSAAQRVLLLVHGIIGDTLGLAQGLAPKHLGLEDVPAVAEHYDLILAFDYECIASGIERNANELKNRLTEVGLGAGHDKTLDLVVHSMGGLISRTFIERLGGAAQVRRLVMLGTPNAGSPWPTVVPWVQHTITSLAVLGLNALGTVIWPAQVLSATIGWLGQQKLQNLEEMRPDSAVLKALFAAEDPHVPYTVICGDITLDLGRKATFTRLRNQFASGMFLDQPNDIATTVAGACQIPKRQPETTFVPAIACDHLNYFASREALHALAQSLESRGP
jgi:uncharacterized caspase-like protein